MTSIATKPDDASNGHRRRWPQRIVLLLLAAGIVTGSYWNHFGNAFQLDDQPRIASNPSIRTLEQPGRFLTDPHASGSRPQDAVYRPLLVLSFALDHALARDGSVPTQYRRTQLALLLLLGALLALLFRRLYDLGSIEASNTRTAIFAACLFCVHTANTATLNHLALRSNLFGALGIVGSFLTYLAWPGGRNRLLYLLPMAVGALAAPSAWLFAPLLCVFALFFEEDGSIGDLFDRSQRRKAGAAFNYAFPAFVAAAVLFVFVRWMDAESARMPGLERLPYLATQPFAWLVYLRLFLLPLGLNAAPDWPMVAGWGDLRLPWGALFIAGLGWAIWRLSGPRRWRPAAFGLAWFAVALVPSSSFIPHADPFNEGRGFIPYIGLAFGLTWCAALVGRHFATDRPLVRRALAAAAVVALVALAWGTHVRNRAWLDDRSFWADVVRKAPSNSRALMNLGVALMSRGQLEEARGRFEQAQELAPRSALVQVNLGIVKSALDDPAAESHFLRALELAPRYAGGHGYYADWLGAHGRGTDAMRHLETAVELNPGDVLPARLLLHYLAATGNTTLLGIRAKKTLAFAPSDPTASSYAAGRIPFQASSETAKGYERLGHEKTAAKRWVEAAVIYRRSLALDPSSATVWNNLGWALLKLGFPDLAIPCFQAAIDRDPTTDRARSNLEWARTQLH